MVVTVDGASVWVVAPVHPTNGRVGFLVRIITGIGRHLFYLHFFLITFFDYSKKSRWQLYLLWIKPIGDD